MEPIITLSKEQTTRLKGIAIIIVMCAHIGLLKNGTGGVALFLFLSGFGLMKSYDEKGLKSFWKKKITNVYFPYIIVAILQLLIYRITDPKKTVITISGLSFGLNVDPTYWYISYLLFWYIAFYISGVIAKFIYGKTQFNKDYIILMLIIAVIPLLQILINKGFWTSGSGANLYKYMFPLGVLGGILSKCSINRIINKILWCIIFLSSVAYIFSNYGKVNGDNYLFFTVLQATLWISAVQLVNRHTKNQVLDILGRYSYGIYLCEGFFMVKVYEWWEMISIIEIQHCIFFAASIVSAFILQNGFFSLLNKNSECGVVLS